MATIRENLTKAAKKVGALVNSSFDLVLLKAQKSVRKEMSNTVFSRKAIVADSDYINTSSSFIEKGTLISFDMLRQLSERDMIVVAIVSKIMNRISAFAHPQKDKYSLGFRIKLNPEFENSEDNDLDDNKTNINEKENRKEIADIVRFLVNTGIDDEARPTKDRMSLETFFKLIVKDRLIYNQIGIECIPTRDGSSLAYFVPVSGGSIRFISPNAVKYADSSEALIYDSNSGPSGNEHDQARLERNEDTELDDVEFAQIFRGQIYALFTRKELIYKQGMPSVDLAHNGYAPGEMELLINAVANHRIAESHNERFFKFGYGSHGILNIKSIVSEEDLQAIKRQFQRQYQGVRNAFKMPILASKDGVEFINTSPSNRDMEWSFWMEYLIKIITAVYGISPSEINFDISRGSGPSLSDSGLRNDVILRDTRNSLLRPLLRWLESIINDDLLPKYNVDLAKKYVFEFVGINDEGQDVELERVKSKVTSYMTVNEIREEEGKDSLGEDGDVILESNFIQWKQFLKQQQQERQPAQDDEFSGVSTADSTSTDVGDIIDNLFSDDIKENDEGTDNSSIDVTDDSSTSKSTINDSMDQIFKSVKKPQLVKVEYWKK